MEKENVLITDAGEQNPFWATNRSTNVSRMFCVQETNPKRVSLRNGASTRCSMTAPNTCIIIIFFTSRNQRFQLALKSILPYNIRHDLVRKN